MRVISGSLGGRNFQSPSSHKTHPMSDKIRGALFNILGDISGLTFLDAFAGSGAIAFEAISRGAKSVVCIDSDRIAQKVVAKNISDLELSEEVKLISANAGAWLHTTQDRFDIVVCDPPYGDLQTNLIKRLAGTVANDGLLVLSWPGGVDLPLIDDFGIVEQREYGDAQLAFYRAI